MIWYLADKIALKWTATSGWGIFWGENFRKFCYFSLNLWDKIQIPQSQLLHFTKYIHIIYLQQMHKLMYCKFCIVLPWQRYIPAWTHDVISHSSVAKQQQSILYMFLYIAYSVAGQFIACMCQISLVYLSLRKRYESTLSYFWLTLIYGNWLFLWSGFSSCNSAIWKCIGKLVTDAFAPLHYKWKSQK